MADENNKEKNFNVNEENQLNDDELRGVVGGMSEDFPDLTSDILDERIRKYEEMLSKCTNPKVRAKIEESLMNLKDKKEKRTEDLYERFEKLEASIAPLQSQASYLDLFKNE